MQVSIVLHLVDAKGQTHPNLDSKRPNSGGQWSDYRTEVTSEVLNPGEHEVPAPFQFRRKERSLILRPKTTCSKTCSKKRGSAISPSKICPSRFRAAPIPRNDKSPYQPFEISGPAPRQPREAPGAEKLEGALYAEHVRSTVQLSGKSNGNSGLRTGLTAFLKAICLHSKPPHRLSLPFVLHTISSETL